MRWFWQFIPQENVSRNLSLPGTFYNKTSVHPVPLAVFSSRIPLAKEGQTVACPCRWCVG